MSLDWTRSLEHLIWGPLLRADSESLCFRAVLCDLRPRFIPKCRVGSGYRAVSRNGRILLASNRPMESLIERQAAIRLQPWRKIILPGDRPETYGLLMCARCLDPAHPSDLERRAVYRSFLASEIPSGVNLAIDVGGKMTLVFCAGKRGVHTPR